MKTSYTFFALAVTLLALGACNQEELGGELPAMSGENISFATPTIGVEVGTRAPLNQLANGTSFGVLGYCLAQTSPSDETLNQASGSQEWDYKKQLCYPEVFYKQEVTYDNRICTYSPLREWYASTDYNYSFFAYYPSNAFTVTTGVKDLGSPSVKFSIPFDYMDPNTNLDESQVPDAMAAQVIDVTRNAGLVQLRFQHLLTGLNFQVNNYNVDNEGNSGNSVTIHSLKLRGKFYKSVEINFDRSYDFPDETFYGTYTILGDNDDDDVTIAGLASESEIGGKTLLLVSNLNKTSKEDGYLGQLELEINYSFGNSIRQQKVEPRPENFQPSGGTIYTAQLNFIGDSFVLNFIVDNNQQWEDGGDSEITFE